MRSKAIYFSILILFLVLPIIVAQEVQREVTPPPTEPTPPRVEPTPAPAPVAEPSAPESEETRPSEPTPEIPSDQPTPVLPLPPSGEPGEDIPDSGLKPCPPHTLQFPDCGDKKVVNDFDSSGCLMGYHCEDSFGEPRVCPVDQVCADGTHPCRFDGPNCICSPCPPPQGCREERDPETGFVHVVCEEQHTCPPIPEDRFQECQRNGGNPVIKTDPSGCKFFDCLFGQQEGQGSFFTGRSICPTQQDTDNIARKCEELGMESWGLHEGGCFIMRCRNREMVGPNCPEITLEQKESINEKCRTTGSTPVEDFDNSGCRFWRCADEFQCQRDLPEEAYRQCETTGGEMIVNHDPQGCITFRKCVYRGEENGIGYERDIEVPEPTEILGIALKLERLKIDFDTLARKIKDIANYYESTGSSEEERFRRAAGMFSQIRNRVDEIKEDLRNRLEGITREDIIKVKHDLRYIKDVMLKDILYVMLSTDREIIEIETKSETDCGTDGSCFDRAFRVCKPVKFYPEGFRGPEVVLKGLEGDLCILHAEMKGVGPAGFIDMDCKIPDYSLGIEGPEDIMPYCEGVMKDFFEKYGTEGPSGPGGCKGDYECDRFCRQNPEVCMQWCKDNPELCNMNRERDFEPPVGEGFEEDFERNPEDFREPSGSGPGPGPGEFGEGSFPDEEFEREPFREPVSQPRTLPTEERCVGCLNNNVCDPGECRGCPDCVR